MSSQRETEDAVRNSKHPQWRSRLPEAKVELYRIPMVSKLNRSRPEPKLASTDGRSTSSTPEISAVTGHDTPLTTANVTPVVSHSHPDESGPARASTVTKKQASEASSIYRPPSFIVEELKSEITSLKHEIQQLHELRCQELLRFHHETQEEQRKVQEYFRLHLDALHKRHCEENAEMRETHKKSSEMLEIAHHKEMEILRTSRRPMDPYKPASVLNTFNQNKSTVVSAEIMHLKGKRPARMQKRRDDRPPGEATTSTLTPRQGLLARLENRMNHENISENSMDKGKNVAWPDQEINGGQSIGISLAELERVLAPSSLAIHEQDHHRSCMPRKASSRPLSDQRTPLYADILRQPRFVEPGSQAKVIIPTEPAAMRRARVRRTVSQTLDKNLLAYNRPV